MHSRRILKQVIIPLVLAATVAAVPALAAAQQQTPSAPSDSPIKFPAPEAANFTAASPSRATVDAFLKQEWGYDTARVWQVWAIETPSPGISRVIVQVAQQNDPQHQIASASFLVTPDGKHLIANNLDMQNFGDHPFAETRDMLNAARQRPKPRSREQELRISRVCRLPVSALQGHAACRRAAAIRFSAGPLRL